MLRTVFLIGLFLVAANAFSAQQTQDFPKIVACFLIAKSHALSQKEIVQDIIMSLQPSQKQLSLNKIFALAIEHCSSLITMEKAQIIVKSAEDSTLKTSEMFYLLEGFDYKASAANPEELTQNQEMLIQVIIEFNERIQAIRKQKEAKSNNPQTEEDRQAQKQQAGKKLAACLLLSKSHASSHKEVVENIIMALQPQLQQTRLNKIYVVAVEQCFSLITIDQANKILSTQDQTEMFYLLEGFDYEAAAANTEEMTQDQEMWIQVIKEVDEQKRKQKESEENNVQTEEVQGQYFTKIVSCLILSRYHTFFHDKVIQRITKQLSPQKKKLSLYKIYAVAIEHCFPLMPIDQGQKIIQLFQKTASFYPSEMFYIFEGFDYEAAAANPEELTQTQEWLVQQNKEFNEKIQEKLKQIGAKKNFTQTQEDRQQEAQIYFKILACLRISRSHTISQKKVIQEIILSLQLQLQQPSLDKIYAVAVEHCFPLIRNDQARKICQQFLKKDSQFDLSEMFYIFEGFNYEAAAANPEQLTQNQEGLMKAIKKIDEQILGKQEREDEENNPQTNADKILACILLSRSHASSHKEVVDNIIMALQPQLKQTSLDKIQTIAVQHCFPLITIDQANKILQLSTQDLTEMFYLLEGFDYEAAAANPEQLTKTQESVMYTIKVFDEQMQLKQEQMKVKLEREIEQLAEEFLGSEL